MKLPLSKKMKVRIGSILSPFIPVVEENVALVTKASAPFGGNIRRIADELLENSKRKVFIYSEGYIQADTKKTLEAKGAVVLTGFSLTNLRHILSCGTILVGHSIRDAHIGKSKPGRQVINLWHGVPIKRIELLMENQLLGSNPSRLELMRLNAKIYDRVLASNPDDAKVMSQAFGVPLSRVLASGLPRFDYMRDDCILPADLITQQTKLREQAGERRIILYSPTFRENSKSPLYELTSDVIEKLTLFADEHNCVFAIRPHPNEQALAERILSTDNDCLINASSAEYPETAILLREASALITDYSSIWVDYLLRNRPIIGLMPDMDDYLAIERGFIYDFESLFPGSISTNWDQALASLRLALTDLITPNSLSAQSENRRRAMKLLLPEILPEGETYSRKLTKMLEL